MKKFNINAFMPLIKVWGQYKSPWVPEGEELKIFEKFLRKALKQHRDKRVLILGSTPQLRDLAHKLGAEVTVVDVSLEMMIGLSYLMKYKKLANQEIWVRQNWLQAPLEKGYWSIVLGDWVICNISKKLQSTFSAKISSLLTSKGCFITKAYFVWDKKVTADEVIQRFLSKNNPSFRNYQDYFTELFYTQANPKTWNHSVNDLRSVLRRFAKKSSSLKIKAKISKHLKMLDYLLGSGDFVWACPTEKAGEKVFTKNFIIKNKQYSREHPFGKYNPIYLFQKK
ncbi:MAG: hypothetical protein PHV78_03010 [Patescibacteria group bacterium]|nr:hypothetical protein [Patescibacteria group bacterium]MDD5121645.1 hypothetical protein [Patescibacteria group bacterium]MDD5221901.1 hypothetical protein [Patescibacteria group bacterium]MDD5396191.1 hypothetical protein [Patescibacteria group bacterium]